MSIKHQAHIQAITELLELMNLAFMIALVSDCCWVLRDIAINGATVGLVLIASGLWLAFVIVLIGFVKYHNKQVKKILRRLSQKNSCVCR